MKQKLLFASIFLSFIIAVNAQAQKESYYYYKGNKIELKVNNNLYYISSTDSLSLTKKNSLRQGVISSSPTNLQGVYKNGEKRYWRIVSVTSPSGTTTPTLRSAVQNSDIYIAPVYGEETSRTKPIATSEYFYVKLKNKNDYSILQQQAEIHDCQVVKPVEYVPLWYIIRAPSTSNGISMANTFYETEKFKDVDPAFMFHFRPTCTNEPNFSKQWGLLNEEYSEIDINVCDVWTITKGDPSIIVGVLDQGVDQDHQEFEHNYSPFSYDLHNKSTPSILRGEHGTHVGGIIRAEHNNIQVAGVAPGTTILSISHDLNLSNTFSSEMASGFGYAEFMGVDVLNNSWGDQGGAYYSQMYSSILEEAIESALINGRNGKGMVVVFASGNYEDNTTLDYPGNFHPDILTVGAINKYGERKSRTSQDGEYWWGGGSSYGEALDVVAPGVDVYSTLPFNSVGSMSGTSMAAPYVAGVAGLILSVNPELTGMDVRRIIESTSRKVGDYSYTKTAGRINGKWNNEMGYGLVDAYRAVKLAKPISSPLTLVPSVTHACEGDFITYRIEGLDSISRGRVAVAEWVIGENLIESELNCEGLTSCPLIAHGNGYAKIEVTVAIPIFNEEGYIVAIDRMITVRNSEVWVGPNKVEEPFTEIDGKHIIKTGPNTYILKPIAEGVEPGQGNWNFAWDSENWDICCFQVPSDTQLELFVASPEGKEISAVYSARNKCGEGEQQVFKFRDPYASNMKLVNDARYSVISIGDRITYTIVNISNTDILFNWIYSSNLRFIDAHGPNVTFEAIAPGEAWVSTGEFKVWTDNGNLYQEDYCYFTRENNEITIVGQYNGVIYDSTREKDKHRFQYHGEGRYTLYPEDVRSSPYDWYEWMIAMNMDIIREDGAFAEIIAYPSEMDEYYAVIAYRSYMPNGMVLLQEFAIDTRHLVNQRRGIDIRENIRVGEKTFKTNIYSTMGVLLYSSESQEEVSINTLDLDDGVYIIEKVNSEGVTERKKVYIKK